MFLSKDYTIRELCRMIDYNPGFYYKNGKFFEEDLVEEFKSRNPLINLGMIQECVDVVKQERGY